MKEFDMNGFNNENEQNNYNESVENKANSGTENLDGTQGNKNEMRTENTPPAVNDSSRVENPYFRGYGDYRQNDAQNQQNNAPYGYYNPNQSSNSQRTYDPYAKSEYRYSAPTQNQGQICYTPAKPKKEKKKSGISKGAVAGILTAAIIISGVCGFSGALLADAVMGNHKTQVSGDYLVQSGSENVVIQRNYEEVITSTGIGDSENLSFSAVAQIVKDSVVEITTEFNNTSVWYNYVQTGAGSGVIISTDGYIITNTHVITDESSGKAADAITVRLTDGTDYSAEVIGYDTDSDIAIIKINASGLAAALCGNSDNLAVGEELVIVGNPLGELGGTVTNGIVSATEREIEVNGVTMNLIQTNAAVNPGNSGGGMFNMKGELVGIVNAKSSGTGIEGLGFAIPINEALEVTEQLVEYGYVRGKTMIGVTFTDVTSNNLFYYYNIKAGVYVDSLTKGYNDDVLQPGDRVVAVNGNTVSATSEIKAVVTSSSVGDKLEFQIERNGKLMTVEVECFEKVPDTQNNIEFEEESEAAGNYSYFGGFGDSDVYASPFGSDIFEKFFGN